MFLLAYDAPMILSALIAAYRKQHNVSIRQLARTIGINHCSLFKFERGQEIESENLLKVLRWMFMSLPK